MENKIVIQFTGKDSTEKIYQMELINLKDSIKALCALDSKEEKMQKKRDLLECIAILDNALFQKEYPDLYRKSKEEATFLNRKKKNEPEPFTIENGKKITEKGLFL